MIAMYQCRFILHEKCAILVGIIHNEGGYVCFLFFLGGGVLKGLVGLHRTVKLQLLQRYWLGHRLGLL